MHAAGLNGIHSLRVSCEAIKQTKFLYYDPERVSPFFSFQKSIFLVEAKETQKDLFQLQQLEIIKQHGERSANNSENS